MYHALPSSLEASGQPVSPGNSPVSTLIVLGFPACEADVCTCVSVDLRVCVPCSWHWIPGTDAKESRELMCRYWEPNIGRKCSQPLSHLSNSLPQCMPRFCI